MATAPLRASPTRNRLPEQNRSETPRPGGRGAGIAAAELASNLRPAHPADLSRDEISELRRRARAYAGTDSAARVVELDQPELDETQEPGAVKPLRARLRLAPPVPVVMPRTTFIVGIVLVVVLGVLGILVLNTKINQNAFRIADLRAEQTALDLREQELERFIAEQEAPGSLAAAAAKLGLTSAGPPAFILLPDGKIIGVPRPAQGSVSNASQ